MPRGPGIFFLLPCIDEMKIVDIRTVTCIVDPQELLTKDSVTVKVDAVVYHRVFEPMSAVTKVLRNPIKKISFLFLCSLNCSLTVYLGIQLWSFDSALGIIYVAERFGD